MPIFLVRLRCQSTIHLTEPLNFIYADGTRVCIRDASEQDTSGVPYEIAWVVDVILECGNIEVAMDRAPKVADLIINVMSFAHSCAVASTQLMQAIDSSPGTVDREVVQILQLPSKVRPTRKLREDAVRSVWEPLNRLGPAERERILYCLQWYRKGLFETVELDRFINYWTSLEIISPLIARKHGLSTMQAVRKCPKCQEPYAVPTSTPGARHVFLRILNETNDTWNQVLGTRNAMIHGEHEKQGLFALHEIAESAIECIPVLRRAVVAAVLEALGVQPYQCKKVQREPLGLLPGPCVIARVSILQMPFKFLEKSDPLPHFEFANVDSITWVSETDRRNETWRNVLKLVGADGFEKGPLTAEIRAFRDPEDTSAELTIQLAEQ